MMQRTDREEAPAMPVSSDPSNARFAHNLALLRKARGLSQEQLAESLGVSRQSVSKWESGVSHS